jgi:hypothetical protein
MATTKNEVKEIEIFTLEQLEILPKEAKDSIITLGDNLPQKELMILNPLVAELLKIKELAKIKYVPLSAEPTKTEIADHKDNIAEFKEAKKSISALTTQNALAKKAIKGPLDALGKEVLNIERSVNSIAKEVLEALETTFAGYLEAEKIKAAEALAKREEKAKAAVNELTEQNKAQSAIFAKSILTNFLKYELLVETKTEVNNAIDNYALDKLFTVRDMLSLKTWSHLTTGKDLSVYDEAELKVITDLFDIEIAQFKKNINNRIDALELQRTNEKLLEAVEESKAVPAAPEKSPTLMGSTNMFEVIQNGATTPLGAGGSMNTVPRQLYPTDDKNVDFLDLIIGELTTCKENMQFITNRFSNSTENSLTDQDRENIRRVKGASILIDRTVLYILDKLPKVTK